MTGPRSPGRSVTTNLLANRRRSLLLRGFGGSVSSASPAATTAVAPPPCASRNAPQAASASAPPSSTHFIMPIATIEETSGIEMEDEREEAIHVAVRFRPLNAKELASSTTTSSTSSTPSAAAAAAVSSRRPSIKAALKAANQNKKLNASQHHHQQTATSPQSPHRRHRSSNSHDEQQAARAWSLVAAAATSNNPTTSKCHHSVIQKGAARKVEGRTVFSFDSVFGEASSTLDVYHGLAKPLLEAVLRGQHATMFAYGQTGSGKTHTMHGDTVGSGATSSSSSSSPNEGIIHMTLADMFQQMQLFPEREFRVRVSFFEIYNEKVRDLLLAQNTGDDASTSHHSTATANTTATTTTTSRLVQVRGDPSGVHVQCREEVIHTMEDAKRILAIGHANRTSASTHMNERSSRSHAIFRITVESCDKPTTSSSSSSSSSHHQRNTSSTSCDTAVMGQVMRVAVLNLVDLSGSESARLTGSTGQRQREGGMINQSLLSLSQVIYSLSLPPKKRPSYINYRDSKLTRILQPHLSGNARIAILCCASPATAFVEETRATLMFASRAKLVQTKPQVNEVLDDKVLLKRLIRELEEARQAIRQMQQERLQEQKEREMERQERLMEQQERQVERQQQKEKEALLAKQLQEQRVLQEKLVLQQKLVPPVPNSLPPEKPEVQLRPGTTLPLLLQDENLPASQENVVVLVPKSEPLSSMELPPDSTPTKPCEGVSLPFALESPYTPRRPSVRQSHEEILDTPSTPLPTFPLSEDQAALTNSNISHQKEYNLEFRPLHSDDVTKLPLGTDSAPASPLFVAFDTSNLDKPKEDGTRRNLPPELASTTATPQGSSKQGTSSHSLQVTALPFRLMYNEDQECHSSYGSHKTGDGPESDVARADNVSPRASFIIDRSFDRSLGDSSRPRLRSPHGTKPPSEVVIMRESSFRGVPIPEADDVAFAKNHSNHSVDLRARLLDTEQRARFLESKLDASDDLIESLFVELEGARKCIQKLVHRNVHLAALWREAENSLLKEPSAAAATNGPPRSRATTSEDEETRIQHNLSDDEFDDVSYIRGHHRHFKLLKYAIFAGLAFFLFGNTELFLAVAMFVGLTLEVNM